MNTEMDATPPKGYVECERKCGRWHEMHIPGSNIEYTMCARCWNETMDGPGTAVTWQPPIASPKHSAAMAKIGIKTTVDGKCPLCGVTVPGTHIHLCSPKHVEQAHDRRCMLDRDHSGGCKWPGMAAIAYNHCCQNAATGFVYHSRGCLSAPPVHEAPKAAPVQPGLVVEVPCDGCGETNDVEWFQVDNMTRVFCEPCRIEALVWMSAQTGTPYKGPERLSNVLARDEGIESSCWPESDR